MSRVPGHHFPNIGALRLAAWLAVASRNRQTADKFVPKSLSMENLTIAGLSLPLLPLLLLSCWLLVSALNRLPAFRVPGLVDALLNRILLSLLLARLIFVGKQWPAFAQAGDAFAVLLAILDIRDRGFDGHAFVLGLTLLLAHLAWRRPDSRPLLKWAMPLTLLWLLGAITLYRISQPLPGTWPALQFQTLAGAPATLATPVRAEFTLVNLWASWCPPCRAEMPMLAKAERDYPQGRFILLNQGESADAVQRFLQQEALAFRQLWLDRQRQFAGWVGQDALPLTLLFDRHGKLVAGHAGLLSRAQLEALLQQLPASGDTASRETAE